MLRTPLMAPRGLAIVAALACATSASAQLTDLQPGRNFPVADTAFGASSSESVDVGDVDRDGDLDVLIANGGDSGSQLNRLYINQGGAQGGVVGTFVDESATRLAGIPADSSRDGEFADVDGDGDLDVLISNRGTTVAPQVSRAYRNQGGLQHGNVGFYTESTESFWGTLVSVPGSLEVGLVDGQGPFTGYSCDCDFGDLNDDGQLDLVWSSYGPNINGTRDSLLFLNDGNGRFDELWPWADPGADIRMHVIDIDLADLDGDWDLDLFATSRDSQARVFRSDLYGAAHGPQLYTDVTQTALIDTGAGLIGTSHYESELADLDGDGDVDVWTVDYNQFHDIVLINEGGLTFSAQPGLVAGDPAVDENEVDFFDYDGDGDLDAFFANFSGTNWIYQGGLADGLQPQLGDALFHRTGTSAGGSQAPWHEVPSASNGGRTLDGEAADLDNDGDPDLLLANELNQNNRVWFNALGVPDSHAPEVLRLTEHGDKSDGTDTIVHAYLRDNAAWYVVAMSAVDLVYSVDGGAPVVVPMMGQGGQQFRGVIPAAVSGVVSYHVEATDRAGNTGLSQTVVYTQTSSASSAWQQLGGATVGVAGDPQLVGQGDLSAGSTARLGLVDSAPFALAALFLSTSSTPTAFKGGTLHTFPVAVTVNLLTGSGGLTWIEFVFPPAPSGVPLWWQYAIADASHPTGVALSNALLSTTP